MAQQVSSDYAARRKPGTGMLRHVELESNLSLTGSNADKRIKIKPSEVSASLAYLINQLGGSAPSVSLRGDLTKALQSLAGEMKSAKGKTLVLVGGDDANAKVIGIGEGEFRDVARDRAVGHGAQPSVQIFQIMLKRQFHWGLSGVDCAPY
jgi:hypothetical protein